MARRNFVEKEIQSLTDAVNRLGRCQSAPVSRDAESTHECFIARARACVEERFGEERFFEESTHEAVRALLRSRSGYADEPDAGVGGLASFKQGNVSLPASSVGSPLLRSLVSDKALGFLDDISSMLNNSDDLAAAGLCDPQLYMDPVLGRRGGCIQRLHQGSEAARDGKIHASPKGACDGLFCVKKEWSASDDRGCSASQQSIQKGSIGQHDFT